MNSKLCFILIAYCLQEISCHAILLHPPGRSSVWRVFPSSAPTNYDDNALFCGGAYVQNEIHNGKCGVCGDSYGDPHPQDNENTGKYWTGSCCLKTYVISIQMPPVWDVRQKNIKCCYRSTSNLTVKNFIPYDVSFEAAAPGPYGTGFVVEHYEPGEVINVTILLTANHLGHFTYSLCELEDPLAPESGEECFENLLLEDGSETVPIGHNDFRVENRVVLPNKTCERCVLRWTYKAGNSWGFCGNGEQGVGCGPQEHFRSCADISIREKIHN